MSDYTSSIVSKYGDVDNVKRDVKVLYEILGRQGTALLIDVIAEHAGETAIKFHLGATDRDHLLHSLVSELKEALSERL